MGVLLNAKGIPEAPTEIVRGLRNLHPSYGLRFIDGGRWAITWEWPEKDSRWSRVRSQEIPRESAYDIIGSLPIDCPVDQAAGYVERAIKAYPIEEVRKHISRISHWNDVEVPKAQTQELVTSSLEDFSRGQRQQNPRRERVF